MGVLDSPPDFIRSGEIILEDVDLLKLDDTERRELMGNRIAVILQDTLSYLNPVYSVGW